MGRLIALNDNLRETSRMRSEHTPTEREGDAKEKQISAREKVMLKVR